MNRQRLTIIEPSNNVSETVFVASRWFLQEQTDAMDEARAHVEGLSNSLKARAPGANRGRIFFVLGMISMVNMVNNVVSRMFTDG